MNSDPHVHTPRRGRLLGLAAAALLALLGPALAQGPDQDAPPATQAAVDADPVLLRLGSTVERLSDIEWRFGVAMRSFAAGQGMAYTPDLAEQLSGLMPRYLEQRGTELVLLREAGVRGLAPDEDSVAQTLETLRASVAEDQYEAALEDAGFTTEERLVTIIREADLITQVLEALQSEAEPTEHEVRVRYLADVRRYTQPEQFCARHILVEEAELAEEIVARVAAGDDFAALAAEHGTDGTAQRGGDLGCFQRGMMVAPFEEAVVGAEVGAVTGPVETQFGYHAVLVYDHLPATVVPYEEVRDAVAASVASDAASAAMQGLLRGSGLVTFPERLAGL